MMLSTAVFSSVVEAIYDASLDSSRWPVALTEISRSIGSATSAPHFLDMERQIALGAFMSHGTPQSDADSILGKGYAQMWALQGGIMAWPVGQPMHLPEILPAQEFLAGRFYREWVKPLGQRDYIGMVALRRGQRMVKSSNGRRAADGPYRQEDVEFFRLLAPHLTRAVHISNALDVQALVANQLESALSALSTGVILVTSDGRISYANATGEQQLRAGGGLSVREGRIRAADPAADRSLQSAILSASARDMTEAADAARTIALRDRDGPGFILYLVPLNRGDRQFVSEHFSATVSIFVQDMAVAPPLPGEAFARLYGLTPREMQVLLALMPSRTPADVADILGVSLATVKTHIAALFAKTDTSRQADLVALASRSVPPIILP